MRIWKFLNFNMNFICLTWDVSSTFLVFTKMVLQHNFKKNDIYEEKCKTNNSNYVKKCFFFFWILTLSYGVIVIHVPFSFHGNKLETLVWEHPHIFWYVDDICHSQVIPRDLPLDQVILSKARVRYYKTWH